METAPAPDDDETGAETVSAADSTVEAETRIAPKNAEEEVVDPRDRLTQRYRAFRDAENAKEAEDDKSASQRNSALTLQPESETDENAESESDSEEAAAETAAETSQLTTIKLKVDGEEVEKTIDEIKVLAQLGLAGNNRYESSKELISTLKALKDQLTANQRGAVESGTSPDSATAESDQVDPKAQAAALEKLEKYVERIQVGDVKEGAQALADILTEVRKEFAQDIKAGQSADPADFDARVDDRVVKRQAAEEINSAVSKFRSEFPDIVKRPLVAEAAKAVAREEMLKDWKAAGAEDSMIEAWRDTDPRLVADVHQQMKVKGLVGIRSYDEILKASAQRIGSEFNIALTKEGGGKEGDKGTGAAKPAPKQEKPRITVGPEEKEARINAKRQQQQPKSAGGREPLHQQARPKTTAEIIAEMKKGRAGAPQR